MTKPFDRAHSIYGEIRVRVYGPLGSETPTCAEALTTAGLIAELQNRVEALEASTAKGFHHIGETNKMVPDGSLVERVAYAITGDSDGPINWKPEARAAILAVADWFEQQDLHIAATRLRMEVG